MARTDRAKRTVLWQVNIGCGLHSSSLACRIDLDHRQMHIIFESVALNADVWMGVAAQRIVALVRRVLRVPDTPDSA